VAGGLCQVPGADRRDSRAETFPPIMGVLEPTNPHSIFYGDESACPVCLSLPFNAHRF
jgi:hypothetical protein